MAASDYSPDELANMRMSSAPSHDDIYPGHVIDSDGHCHTCEPYADEVQS